MKFVSKHAATPYKNAETCTAFEYDTETTDINIARIEVSGRYPESGVAVNTEVTELVYVASGSGCITSGDVSYELAKGDVVTVLAGERVFWQGTLTLIIACTPAWYPEQYEIT